MQGQVLPHSLLQAKSYRSPRVTHAEQILRQGQGAAQPQLVPSCLQEEQGRSDTTQSQTPWLHPTGSEHVEQLCVRWEWAEQGEPVHGPKLGAGSSCSLRWFMRAESRTRSRQRSLCNWWQRCQQPPCLVGSAGGRGRHCAARVQAQGES